MSTLNALRDVIMNDLAWTGDPEQLTGDYPLIENDVIDSLGIYQIVSFLEERYGIEVDDDDLVPDNFETLSAIAQLVETKTGT